MKKNNIKLNPKKLLTRYAPESPKKLLLKKLNIKKTADIIIKYWKIIWLKLKLFLYPIYINVNKTNKTYPDNSVLTPSIKLEPFIKIKIQKIVKNIEINL